VQCALGREGGSSSSVGSRAPTSLPFPTHTTLAGTNDTLGTDLTDTLGGFNLLGGGSNNNGSNNNGVPPTKPAAAEAGTAAEAGSPKPRGRALRKLEAFLLQRAKSDVQLLPVVRGAMRNTTSTLRRARFGMGVIGFAAWAARGVQYASDARDLRVVRASLAAAGAVGVPASSGSVSGSSTPSGARPGSPERQRRGDQ